MVFICKICENNRQPITESIEKAMEILGKQAHFNNKKIVDSKFYAKTSRDDIYAFEIKVNSSGEGTIDVIPEYFDLKIYNYLYLINHVKSIVEKLDAPRNIYI